MIKGFIQLEDITLVNISASNIGRSTLIQKAKIIRYKKREIYGNTMIIDDFNTLCKSND